jgi:hypothetical protein
LSDEELLALAQKHGVEVPTPKPPTREVKAEPSDEELLALADKHGVDTSSFWDDAKEFGKDALEKVGDAGEFVDRYTGAPTRSGVGALLDGKGVKDAAGEFIDHMGAESSTAPTPKDLKEKLGLPTFHLSDAVKHMGPAGRLAEKVLFTDNHQPKEDDGALEAMRIGRGGPGDLDLSELGVGAATDYTNLIPGEALLKGAGKIGKTLGEGLGVVAKGTGRAALGAAGAVAPTVTKLATDTAQGIEHAAVSIAKAVKPSIRPEYAKDVALAIQNGINPDLLSSAVKYGPESFISKADRVAAQGVTGEQKLLRHQEGLNQTREAVNRQIEDLAGGAAPDAVQAGESMRDGYNTAVDKFFKDRDVTYDTVYKQNPGLALTDDAKAQVASTIEGVRRKAIRLANRGATPGLRAQGKMMLENLEVIGNVTEGGSFKQTVEELRDIGDAAFKKIKGAGLADIPPNVELNRDLYFGLRDALHTTTEATENGGELVQRLKANNEQFTKFFRTNEKIAGSLLDDTKGGEKLFKEIIESGDTVKIRALKEILKDDPQTLNKMKAAFLENLKVTDKDGGFSFARMHNALRNDDRVGRVAKELFDKGELDKFKNLVALGDKFGPPILNFSGTDVSSTFRNIPQALTRLVGQESVLRLMRKFAENPEALSEFEKGLMHAAQSSPGVARALDDAHAAGTLPGMVAKTPLGASAVTTAAPQFSKKELTLKALRLFHLAREQGQPVPPEVQEHLRSEIKGSRDLDSIEKAKALNSLHRTGHIENLDDVAAKLVGDAPPPPLPDVRGPKLGASLGLTANLLRKKHSGR